MPKLLVIDDEVPLLQFLRVLFPEGETTLLTAETAAEGLRRFAADRPDAVLLDIDLPDQPGMETFLHLHRLDPRVPIIFITGRGTTATAIEAMTLGAYDYVLKPFHNQQLRELVQRAFQASRMMRVPAVVPDAGPLEKADAEELVGRSPGMQEVYKAIGRVAPQDVTVLITGESGTGKELVARALYHYSRRARGPFLAINCAAIPDTLLESELFGHEQGAFTGASQRRVGKFEQCTGGTLFLDEVGELAPMAQAKILRVLQEQQFERVGGSGTIQTDVRLIAATNRDLDRLVARGQFRRDLYYRLHVYTISLPPLRERLSDLPLLVEHFLRRFRKEMGKDVEGIVPEALDLLRRYAWPGNVRELQSALKHAMLQAAGPVLLPECFHPAIRGAAEGVPASPEGTDALDRFVAQRLQVGGEGLYADWLALAERRLFAQVLRHTAGNLSQAARILGIHRATLRNRVAALGLSSDEMSAEA